MKKRRFVPDVSDRDQYGPGPYLLVLSDDGYRLTAITDCGVWSDAAEDFILPELYQAVIAIGDIDEDTQ